MREGGSMGKIRSMVPKILEPTSKVQSGEGAHTGVYRGSIGGSVSGSTANSTIGSMGGP
jgi:hypothetical protein